MITLISNGHPLVEISVKTLVGYLEHHHIPARAIYLSQIGAVSDKVVAQIKELAKDSLLVGFSLMSKDVDELKPIMDALKQDGKPILWGGIHPTALSKESLAQADFVCVGEGEEPLRQLYLALQAGSTDYSRIPNIGYQQNGIIVLNPVSFFLDSLDDAPYPDYEFKDSYVYSHEKQVLVKIPVDITEKKEVLGMDSFLFYSQRGCHFSCTYCSNSLYHGLAAACQKPWYRLASPARVKDELGRYVKLLPFINGLALNDDDFLARSLADIAAITDFIKQEFNLPFTINGIPRFVTEEKVAVMVKNGLTKISFGVQSGSDKILSQIYRRPQTNEQVMRAAKVCAKFYDQGLEADYGFITDNPYETDDDWRASLHLIMDLPRPRGISLYSLAFFPGTKLTDMALTDGHLKSLAPELNKLYQEDYSYTYPSCLFFLQSYYYRFVPDKISRWLMSDPVVRKFYYWPVRGLVKLAVKQRRNLKRLAELKTIIGEFYLKVRRKIIWLTANRLLHVFIDPWEKWRNPWPKQVTFKQIAKGWSIVIITRPDDLPRLERVIASVEQELSGTPAEIILVGPPSLKLGRQFSLPIKYYGYRDSRILPALITRKKNLGVKLSQYDKVAIFHDYIALEPGWKAGWDDFGDNWEVAINRVKDYDGSRMLDWVVKDYPGLGPGFLPYSVEITRYQYISGAYFAVKRDFYLANPLDGNLRWGEGEDVEWSKRVRQKIVFKFNPHSSVRSAKLKGPIGGDWPANTRRLARIFLNHFKDNGDA